MRLRRSLPLAAVLTLAARAANAAAEGMPQLDFKNPMTLAQVVWLVIIFALFYLLLARWALPRIADVLQHRSDVIGADLEAARIAKAEADAAVAEQSARTRSAQADAQTQLAAAVAAAKARAATQSAEVNARLDAQLREAEGRIHVARSNAMGSLRAVAVDTATAVVSRLTGITPDRAVVDREVASVLAGRAA